MARNYQAKKANPYYIEHDIYMQIYYMIRGYPVLKKRREEILYAASPVPDGQPRGNKTSNPTEKKALVLYTVNEQIMAVEETIKTLADKYHITCMGEAFDPYQAFMEYEVFCRYRSNPDKDMAPCRRTWNRYRCEFAYLVAKKLNYF